MRRRASPRPAQAGFTLIEVLVALLILLLGLLGLAGVLVASQRGEVEAYQRKQAMVLVQDMVDKITGNPVSASCYVKSGLGTGYAGGYVCGAGSLSQQARASADLQAWNDALLGVSEKKAGANVGALIDARGCVTNPSAGVYVISVAWRGVTPTVAPLSALTCGLNQYGTETTRRVQSLTVRIANLAA